MGHDAAPAATRLSDPARARIDAVLSAVDVELDRAYPGDRAEKQPAHTVYVSAADVDADTPGTWGDRAAAALT